MRKPTITEKTAREYLEYFYKNIEKIKGQHSYNIKMKITGMRLIKEPLTDAQILGVEDIFNQLRNQITQPQNKEL